LIVSNPISTLVKLALAFAIACLARGAVAADPAAKDAPGPDIEKLKKAVEKKLSRNEDGHFVIALVTTTFVTNRVPDYLTRGRYAGQQPPPVVIPQTTVRVENAEGRAAAVDSIVQHMTQPVENPAERPPQHEWKLIGRFREAEAARKATEKAQAKYQPPHPAGGKKS